MPQEKEIHAILEQSKNINFVLMLDHGGRAGSNFFQCLFDAHEELVICPLVHYAYSYWCSIFSVRDEITLAEAHEFIAKTSYFRFLYNDPVGKYGEIIQKIGGDVTADFDRAQFRSLIDDLYAGEGNICRRDVFLRAFGAYALCRGFDIRKVKYFGVNDAVSARDENMLDGFSVRLVDLVLEDFPHAKIIALTRDPRAQYASTRHQMVNEFGNNYDLHWGDWRANWKRLWRDDLSLDYGPAHFCLLYQVAAFRALIKKWQEGKGDWYFLRNEDFNTNFVPTMTVLCESLSVKPDPEWLALGDNYKARMMGKPWAGTGAYSSRYQKVTNGPLSNDKQSDVVKMTGPNKYVTERWKTRIPPHEQALLEVFFKPEIEAFGYTFYIPEEQKKNWKIALKLLLPFSGEWPTFSWIKRAANKKELKERLFYTLGVWPLYILSRIKLFRYMSKDHFFERDISDSAQYASLPFVNKGAASEENARTSVIYFISDRANLRVVISTGFSYLAGKKVKNILIEKGASPRIEKIMARLSDVIECPKDLGDYTNQNGVHLFQDREEYLLEAYQNFIAKINFDAIKTSPTAAQNIENIKTFISRYVVHTYAHSFSRALLAVYFSQENKALQPILFLEKHLASNKLRESFQGKKNIKLYSTPRVLREDIKNILRLSLAYLKGFRKSEDIFQKSSVPVSEKRLAVQYINGLENTGYGTDFNWKPASGLDYSDLILLIENLEKKALPESKSLEDKGLKVVVASEHQFNFSDNQIRMNIKKSLRAAKEFFLYTRGGLGTKIHAAALISFYGFTASRWVDIFSKHGILGYVNVADVNLDALPKCHALEYLGGVDLSYEFSATGYHAFMDCRPLGKHQYICWGPITEKMILQCDQKVPYRIKPEKIFHAGNMKFYVQDCMTSEQQEIFSQIKNIKAKHKILVMDSAATHLKFMSKQKISDFYDAVFSLVESRADDIFIIKPQRPLDLCDTQMQKLNTHQESGRVILVPSHGVFHYLLPLVDAVVGMPIYASCIMESCSAQKPVVCFDQMNWPHVMRDVLPYDVRVDNEDGLINAVEKVLNNKTDFGALYKEIDPFGDQKGHDRFGRYLGLWVEKIREHGNADDALEAVCTAYEKECVAVRKTQNVA